MKCLRAVNFILLLIFAVNYAFAETLITEEEAKRPNRGDIDTSGLRGGISPGPTISLVAPISDIVDSHLIKANAVQSPFTLKLDLIAHSGNTIDWGTFKATYLKEPIVPLTDRLKKYQTKDQIILVGAEAPPGTHQILVEVSDSAKRRSWAIVTLAVSKP